MLYMDLEHIYKEQGISDKYVLSMVVTERALQLSQLKNTIQEGVAKEKLISRAVDEAAHGKLTYEIMPKATVDAN